MPASTLVEAKTYVPNQKCWMTSLRKRRASNLVSDIQSNYCWGGRGGGGGGGVVWGGGGVGVFGGGGGGVGGVGCLCCLGGGGVGVGFGGLTNKEAFQHSPRWRDVKRTINCGNLK